MRFKRIRHAPARWRARAAFRWKTEPAVTVTAEHSAALRVAATTLLSGIGDIAIALNSGDWRGARKLRSRYDGLLRLLDDLGWSPHAEPTAITMSSAGLTRVIEEISVYAVERIADQRAGHEASKNELGHLTEICSACTAVHAQVAGGE